MKKANTYLSIVVAEEDKTRPVSLESLLKSNQGTYNYYLSQHEQDLLREYYSRRYYIEDSEELRKRMRLYFAEKFEREGLLEEFKDFINNL